MCSWADRAGPERRPALALHRPGALALAMLFGLLPASPAGAQQDGGAGNPGSECEGHALAELCSSTGQSALTAQGRLFTAAAGGNPVPGTASTLGMRLGSMPRFSVAGRVTVARARALAPSGEHPGTERALIPGLHADLSVGVLQGWSVAPTVGGIGSLDLLLSGGAVLPGEDFGGSALTWSAGARLGLLRESFTLPGLSLSGLYRSLGELEASAPVGGLVAQGTGAERGWRGDVAGWSLRAAASKHLLGFGVTLGGGLDRSESDVTWRFPEGLPPLGSGESRSAREHEQDTKVLFANLSWTLLILHAVAEIGWQEGEAAAFGQASPEARSDADDDALFGSLSVRLSL